MDIAEEKSKTKSVIGYHYKKDQLKNPKRHSAELEASSTDVCTADQSRDGKSVMIYAKIAKLQAVSL